MTLFYGEIHSPERRSRFNHISNHYRDAHCSVLAGKEGGSRLQDHMTKLMPSDIKQHRSPDTTRNSSRSSCSRYLSDKLTSTRRKMLKSSYIHDKIVTSTSLVGSSMGSFHKPSQPPDTNHNLGEACQRLMRDRVCKVTYHRSTVASPDTSISKGTRPAILCPIAKP